MNFIEEQRLICDQYGATFCASPELFKVGISKNVKDGVLPINGLRHPIAGDTTGWYIWAGEYSNNDDFFDPLHVKHLEVVCPAIIKYLALAPGWRFLIAENFEDVWYDSSLVDIDPEG